MIEVTANPWMVLGGIAALVSLIFFVGKWVGGMNEFKSATAAHLKEIREDIKKLLDRLPPAAVSGGSPLRLTELGQSISDELGAVAWADRVAPAVLPEVEGKAPYELQEFCVNYTAGCDFDAEQDAKINSCAYENGIDREQVLQVLAIVLRDKLLASTDS